MTQQTPQSIGRNSNRANTAFMLGLFAILAALAFQYIGGFIPCELCYAQRTPYYIGLPLLAVVIGTWNKVPPPVRIVGTLIVAGFFAWGTYLGAYHSGVEWGWWPGPTSCSGTGTGVSFNDLNNINAARVVPCDKPQIRFFGLSFAGLNAIVSFFITGFLLWSVQGQYVRWRREKL